MSGKNVAIVIREQYYLAKHLGITPDKSDELIIFEIDAYLNLILEDLDKEIKNTPRLETPRRR